MRGEARAFLFGLGAGAAFWPAAYAAGRLSEQHERQDRDANARSPLDVRDVVDAEIYCGSTFMEVPCGRRDGHAGPHHGIRPGGDPLEWPNPCDATLAELGFLPELNPEPHDVPCKLNVGHPGSHISPFGHRWR